MVQSSIVTEYSVGFSRCDIGVPMRSDREKIVREIVFRSKGRPGELWKIGSQFGQGMIVSCIAVCRKMCALLGLETGHVSHKLCKVSESQQKLWENSDYMFFVVLFHTNYIYGTLKCPHLQRIFFEHNEDNYAKKQINQAAINCATAQPAV